MNIKNNTKISEDIDVNLMKDLLNELNISYGDEYILILWNDEVNDIFHVIMSLINICKLTYDESISITMEAHSNGKSIIKKGSFDELNGMKNDLNKKNLEVTIELNN